MCNRSVLLLRRESCFLNGAFVVSLRKYVPVSNNCYFRNFQITTSTNKYKQIFLVNKTQLLNQPERNDELRSYLNSQIHPPIP